MNEIEARERIVSEAKSWLRTPFHHEARVKRVGVDCGMLLLEVFEGVGLIPHLSPPHYGPDFMMHRKEEWYLAYVQQFADELTDGPPYLPGDVLLFRHGRIFSHGAIVINWPRIIHASAPDRVVLDADATQHPLSAQKYRAFRYRFKEDKQ
jgi:cell wall-associated NlpC family hydrolase